MPPQAPIPHHAPPPAYASGPFIQPRAGRLPGDRPLIKLSVTLIDTYKHINNVYYQEREARKKRDKAGKGPHNNGWDDENYDYIINPGEMISDRYKIKERIGKGSFGQVVRAEDIHTNQEVAIKIIKSKKPFLMQAKTEIELLTHLCTKDASDENNIGESFVSIYMHIYALLNLMCDANSFPVRLLSHFMFRNHQCLVFEMLSLNLYELLKNTQFSGVSLNLIRKFAKQVLRALSFLAKNDVDIIHCDLKPENILLRHPKKSGIKVIDFGSSCHSDKRMYSYIQSRFYRSPEVMLGLPYSVSIDMWSLGCILVEMHTGEPLFSGSDQFDQMQKIVKILGMVPKDMIDRSPDQSKGQFFVENGITGHWELRQTKKPKAGEDPPEAPSEPVIPSIDPVASLTEVITSGAKQKKKFPQSEVYNSQRNYGLFIDLVHKMLSYEPSIRITPDNALQHPFITSGEYPSGTNR